MKSTVENELVNESIGQGNHIRVVRNKDVEPNSRKALKSEESVILGNSEEKKGNPARNIKAVKPNSNKSFSSEKNGYAGKGLDIVEVNGTKGNPSKQTTIIVSDRNENLNGKGQITPDIIEKEKKLTLKVMDGIAIPAKTIININAAGVIGSKRNKQDGITYFGTEPPIVSLILTKLGRNHIKRLYTNRRGQRHWYAILSDSL